MATHRIKKYGIAIVVTCALVSPLFASAQLSSEDEERLRGEIRTALLSDPRSSALSEEEFSSLVESLAVEVKSQGVVDDYIPPKPTFGPGSEQTMASEGPYGLWGYSLSEAALYGIILLALAIAMLLLKRVFDNHHRPPMPPTPPAQSAPVI